MSNVYVSYCNLRIVAFFKYKRCSSHVNTRRVLCIEQALLAICAHDVSFYVSLVCFFLSISIGTASMVLWLACSPRRTSVDRGFEPDRTKPRTIPLAFVASPLSTQQRANIGCLGIRIMCTSGVTCLSVDCCFSELAL
jgi:hypothetical protein